MKNLVAVLFVLTFSSFCYTQELPSQVIEEVSVIYAIFEARGDSRGLQTTYSNVPFIQRDNNSSNAPPQPPDIPKYHKQIESIKPDFVQSRARVLFRNNTQKKITSIRYNFIIYDSDGKELKRYVFLNNSDIKANKTAQLSDVVSGLYTNRSLLFKAEIIRVNYKDGSVWIP